MNTDAIKVAAIRAVEKVQGAPDEPKWPEGFTTELLYEMYNEGLIDWLEGELGHYRGSTRRVPTDVTTMREYRKGRNAKEFLKQYSERNGGTNQ